MSGSDSDKLDACGCCGEEPDDHGLYNRPGLDSLVYRIGEHGRFLQRMSDRLPQQKIADELDQTKITRPLAGLATRSTDDASIAMLDAWASTLDVLTFYQERIANEGFLRTATERRSVLELANTIGYRLKPGVAASTWLAFTVEDKDDPFRTASVPRGTQVLSIPAQGELPQTFETDEEIEARAQWNALLPRLGLSQRLALRSGKLYLLDTDGSLGLADADTLDKTGDNAESKYYPIDPQLDLGALLDDVDLISQVQALEVDQIYLNGAGLRLTPGDRLLLVGHNSEGDIGTASFTVKTVAEERQRQYTLVQFAQKAAKPFISVFTLPLLKVALPSSQPLSFNTNTVNTQVLKFAWSQSDLGVAMQMNQWSGKQLKLLLQQPKVSKAGGSEDGVYVFREKNGFFGHNAQAYSTLVAPEGGTVVGSYPVNWDNISGRSISIWENAAKTDAPDYTSHDCYLERAVKGLTADSWVAFNAVGDVDPTIYRVTRADESSLTGFAMSAKTTGLALSKPDGSAIGKVDSAFGVRTTTAYSNSELLTLADVPVDESLGKTETDDEPCGDACQQLMLDQLVLDLRVGQAVAVSGERWDAAGVNATEIKVLKEVTHYGGFTVLQFEEALAYSYRRDTVRVNANVARASHGETVEEVLGSGDAASSHQQFELRKKPLTYTSASTPSGTKSSLTVRVGGVAWQEAKSLFEEQADSPAHGVLIDNESKATVVFGDGLHGQRLPTGQLNITAEYRNGIGLDGEVAAESLSLLKKRPPGINAVINPEAASGAEDPESRDDARRHAPQTVRTLERIVSLHDFQDFAATFSGIGKAQAVPIWDGEAYRVHITLATASGKPLEAGELADNLRDAINAVRDPTVAVELEGFIPLFFHLGAGLKIDPDYLPDQVKAQVRSALEAAFSFARRGLAQPVTAAEIIPLIQAVPGVIYVDLEALYPVHADGSASTTTTPASVLPSLPARWNPGTGAIDPGQLLLISRADIVLEEISNE